MPVVVKDIWKHFDTSVSTPGQLIIITDTIIWTVIVGWDLEFN